MTAFKKESDELIEEVKKLRAECEVESSLDRDCVPVSFWIPREYKKKFSELQDMTDKKFGKALKRAFIRAIDAAIE